MEWVWDRVWGGECFSCALSSQCLSIVLIQQCFIVLGGNYDPIRHCQSQEGGFLES